MRKLIYSSEIYEDEIAGIKFLQYGDPSWPAIIYLHGIGEVGKTPSALLTQSPICRGWDFANSKPSGFKFPDFFTKNIQMIAPILPLGFWEPDFIDKFLDALNLQVPKGLVGWSWGGGGAEKYINQLAPKHSFDFAVICSPGNYSSPGVNVTIPVRMVHAIGDTKTSSTDSQKFWNGIPTGYQIEFLKVYSTDHGIWQIYLEPSTGIYEWMNSLFKPVNVTYTPGVVELGSDGKFYLNVNGKRTELKTN